MSQIVFSGKEPEMDSDLSTPVERRRRKQGLTVGVLEF